LGTQNTKRATAGASSKRPIWIAAALIGLLLLAGAIGPLFAPHDPYKPNLRERNLPPNANHPLGTDHIGRDVLSRVLASLRIDILDSAAIALGASGFALLLKVVFIKRGPLRLSPWLMAILGLLLTVLIGLRIVVWLMPALPSTGSIPSLVGVAMGLLPWTILLVLWGDVGLGSQAVAWLLTWVLSFLHLVWSGFLGVGLPPPQPELGLLLADSRLYLGTGRWLLWSPVIPLCAIEAVLLASTYLLSRSVAVSQDRKRPL